MTGIALGWMGATTAFGAIVKKRETWCGPGFNFVPRSPLKVVQMPAKANSCYSACNFDPLSWGMGVQN